VLLGLICALTCADTKEGRMQWLQYKPSQLSSGGLGRV